jgi:molybdopterin converting factor small subunit
VAEAAKPAQPARLERGGGEPSSGRAEAAKPAQPARLERGGGEPPSERREIAITVRLFASLREAAGSGHLEVRLPEASPVAAVWERLPARVRDGRPPAGSRWAVNREWAPADRPLSEGDEVALVTPVSGGAAGDMGPPSSAAAPLLGATPSSGK